MAITAIRFDLRCPDWSPATPDALAAALLDMAQWAERVGFDICVVSEHHGVDDGYLPSPIVAAAAIAGRTSTIPITISALLVPLHDPLRLAEDLAIVDLLSGGRVSAVVGLGYREEEYEMFDVEWRRRGRLLDAAIETMTTAWLGEPFEYEGRTVRVTPRPTNGQVPLLIGGSSPAAARRAARFGLGLLPAAEDDELVAVYEQACADAGREPGMVLMPRGPGNVIVAEDPDRAWHELGPHLLHEATVYASWQQPGQRSQVTASGRTIEELRAEGVYRILTPTECIALAEEIGPMGTLTFHPLIGGTPPDLAWPHLELFADAVLPTLKGA